MKAMGAQIRRARIRLAYTLDDLSKVSGISKAYLSLIETGRLANPASDEKLARLEQVLSFPAGSLVAQAHVHRTPQDVRAVLEQLLRLKGKPGRVEEAGPPASVGGAGKKTGNAGSGNTLPGNTVPGNSVSSGLGFVSPGVRRGLVKTSNANAEAPRTKSSDDADRPLNLDLAYMSGLLQELAERQTPNVETLAFSGAGLGSPAGSSSGSQSVGGIGVGGIGVGGIGVGGVGVPIVNKVSAGYPSDFTDLSYPPRVADGYLSAPGVDDPDAFAARVSGDSMKPKYAEGDIIIFSPAAAWREGADCFVRFEDGQTTFKRVYTQRDKDGNEVLRLQPRNDRYPPRFVPREQVVGAYKAVAVYRTVEE